MITIEEEIKELQREIQMRKKVFPNWVIQGKITQTLSDKRISCLESSLTRLKKIQKLEDNQTKLF